jgi:Glycerophosphoryl diester phosphodiesterase family
LTATTCTAARIHPPEHPFIENTLPSMRAAFAAGADIVELDIHPTTDGQFAVFHDWTLECHTNGRGVTRERTTLKRCLIRYLLLGWSGYVPADCERSLLLVPANYAPWLWGWPNRFLNRMNAVGTEVFVVGRNNGDDFSSGIDRPEDLALLPTGFAGGIWTNRIDRIAPALKKD